MKKLIASIVLLSAFCIVATAQEKLSAAESTIKAPLPHAERPFRIGIQGGYAQLLNSFADERETMAQITAPGQLDKYMAQLHNGMAFGLDFYGYFNNFVGVGVKYSLFVDNAACQSAIPGYLSIGSSSVPAYQVFNQHVRYYVSFFGESVAFRQYLDRRHRFALGETLTTGFAFLRSEIVTDSYNVLATSANLAAATDLSLEYYALPYLSVSATAGVFVTNFKRVRQKSVNPATGETFMDEGNLDKAMDFSRLDFSLGVRFYF